MVPAPHATSRALAAIAMFTFACGCAADADRRLDAIESRLAAIEQGGPTSRPASLDALVDAARIARARRDACVENLANVETFGFKRRVVRADPARPGEAIVSIDASAGPIENTDRQLDFAINGYGYLRVQLADGVGYTRLGNLFVNNRGELVLGVRGGPQILPPITLPPDAVEVNVADDGTVEALRVATTQPTALGQLQLAAFVDEASLRPDGPNLFRETDASRRATLGSPKAVGLGEIRQGHLEGSNVDALAERGRLADVERELAWIERTIERYESRRPLTSTSARPAR